MKYVAMILGRLYGVFIALVRDNSRGTYATFTPHALAQNPFHPHHIPLPLPRPPPSLNSTNPSNPYCFLD